MTAASSRLLLRERPPSYGVPITGKNAPASANPSAGNMN